MVVVLMLPLSWAMGNGEFNNGVAAATALSVGVAAVVGAFDGGGIV